MLPMRSRVRIFRGPDGKRYKSTASGRFVVLKRKQNIGREIRKEQRSSKSAIPSAPFSRLIKEMVADQVSELRLTPPYPFRVSSGAINALREVTSDYFVELFSLANKGVQEVSGQVTVRPEHLIFCAKVMDDTMFDEIYLSDDPWMVFFRDIFAPIVYRLSRMKQQTDKPDIQKILECLPEKTDIATKTFLRFLYTDVLALDDVIFQRFAIPKEYTGNGDYGTRFSTDALKALRFATVKHFIELFAITKKVGETFCPHTKTISKEMFQFARYVHEYMCALRARKIQFGNFVPYVRK